MFGGRERNADLSLKTCAGWAGFSGSKLRRTNKSKLGGGRGRQTQWTAAGWKRGARQEILCSVFAAAVTIRKTMPDDATLLRRYARERAEDAFAALVQRHLDAVYSAALRRVGGDTHLAEDVAQQVFAALARNAAALAGREILAGWLYTTTRHLAANVVRGERRRKAREQQAESMSATEADRSTEVEWNRVAPLLDAAIDELSEADRTAILLRFVERRAFGEIGAALRVSEDAARMRVERALDKLRAQLARRGIASTAAALGVVMANHAVAAAPAGLAASVTTTASAATSTLTAATWNALQIMSTTKSFSVAAAVIALMVALGTALHQANARRDAEVALAVEQKAHAAQLAQLGDTERRAQQSETEVAQLRKAVDEARAAQEAAKARAAAEAEAAKKEAAAWDGAAEGKALLARHPEVKQALIDFKTASARTRYVSFFASAHLVPEQIEAFLRLVIEGNMIGFPFGPGGKILVLAVEAEAPREQLRDRLRTLLSEEGLRQYDEFGASTTARETVERLASAQVFSDAPLLPAQANELTQVVANAWTKPSGPKAQARVLDWNVVTDRAQGFLSAPQLRALADIRAQEDAQRAADKE
jgi:RNA polymerase sigma factor (sigma-70 family)